MLYIITYTLTTNNNNYFLYTKHSNDMAIHVIEASMQWKANTCDSQIMTNCIITGKVNHIGAAMSAEALPLSTHALHGARRVDVPAAVLARHGVVTPKH